MNSAPQLTAARFEKKSPTASKKESKESPIDARGTVPSLRRSPRERAPEHDAGVRLGHAALALEMAQEAIELRRGGLERLVRARGGEPHVDQRDESAPGGAGVDGRGEPGDHARAPEPADAVGGCVRAEADGGAEVAERDPRVARERTEDLAVDRVHFAIIAVSGGCRWRNGTQRWHLVVAMTDLADPLVSGLLAGW